MTHFVAYLREDRTPLTSPEEQIGSLRVILAAYRAAETGRFVSREGFRSRAHHQSRGRRGPERFRDAQPPGRAR